MVRFKRVLAVVMATSMVLGSSLTAFASPIATTGQGDYEGNKVDYPVLSVTLPTADSTSGQFKYIADPNGLIKESGSQRYSGATWASDAQGVFFKNGENSYGALSKPLVVSNQNAQSIVLSVSLANKTPGQNVAYKNSSTFTGTDKEIYLALYNSDYSKSSAISQATAEGNTTYTAAKLDLLIQGKPSNYALKYSKVTTDAKSETYHYEQISNPTWNQESVYVGGLLNMAADWTSGEDTAAITFPEVTVTWDYAAAPLVTIKSGIASTVTLNKKASGEDSITVSKVTLADGTVVAASNYTATAATAAANATVTLKADWITAAAPACVGDGYVITVVYSDSTSEPIVLLAK